jgi:hypothetical protein
MDEPLDFHDPFNGGATSTFDEPGALSFFWDELAMSAISPSCSELD